MKAGFNRIVVRVALVAYLAASCLGTGLHALVHEHHHGLVHEHRHAWVHEHRHGLVHEHHEHLAHVSLGAAADAIETAVAAADEHAFDADEACPICHFQRLVQLPVSVDETLEAAAVAEAPAIVHDTPQLPHVTLAYSPRGPPTAAANHA